MKNLYSVMFLDSDGEPHELCYPMISMAIDYARLMSVDFGEALVSCADHCDLYRDGAFAERIREN